MKVSLSWLNQLVKVDDLAPEEVANKLTFAGVEVEGIDHLAKATRLVIGKVLRCEKHPDSDHLHVLQVDEGPVYGVHQIVCGAPNAREGLKVIVAREGAVLPEVTIAKSMIRGVESDGMCCALYELGVDRKFLSEKQISGVEELGEDAQVGDENVLSYLGLDDVILDLDLLPSRSDLGAMENVAREIGALYEREVRLEPTPSILAIPSDFRVDSLTPKCPLFGIREVYGISIAPSPKWLQRILTAEGVRSINNVVDIGNYVMLLTGQPLNMYDLDKLPEKELIVRDDLPGDFVAMDGKSYPLVNGDLLVSSKARGMCLAGIMTSAECAVDEKTVNVAIESAYFQGAPIRHTSNRLGLQSESSSRFVKGVNPDQCARVLAIAAQLLRDLAGAKKIGELCLYDTLKHEEKTIMTSLSYINGRLGTSFDKKTILATLLKDHFEILKEEGDSFLVKVPSYRIDVAGEADLSEEVIRLLGFDHIISKLPNVSLSVGGGLSPRQKNKLAIRKFLRNHGLYETVTYALVSPKEAAGWNYLFTGNGYTLKNPMSEDHSALRKNLLRSLLNVASYNVAHQEKDLALFEVSDVDAPGYQSLHLAVVYVGSEPLQGSLFRRGYDFYSLKGVFEGIMELLGINSNRYRYERLQSDKPEFHPGRSAGIYLGRTLVGVMGELHPSALKELDLGKSAAAMEIDLGAFLDLHTSPEKAEIPPKFPSIERDLAMVVDAKTSYEEIRKEIAHTDKLIVQVELFDLYQGSNIAPGKKSLALRLRFQSPERTLKDEEVALISDKVIGALKMRFNAEIRQ